MEQFQLMCSSLIWILACSAPKLTFLFSIHHDKVCFFFVHSLVDARREGNENLLLGIVAEARKLLGIFSYGYRIME